MLAGRFQNHLKVVLHPEPRSQPGRVRRPRAQVVQHRRPKVEQDVDVHDLRRPILTRQNALAKREKVGPGGIVNPPVLLVVAISRAEDADRLAGVRLVPAVPPRLKHREHLAQLAAPTGLEHHQPAALKPWTSRKRGEPPHMPHRSVPYQIKIGHEQPLHRPSRLPVQRSKTPTDDPYQSRTHATTQDRSAVSRTDHGDLDGLQSRLIPGIVQSTLNN